MRGTVSLLTVVVVCLSVAVAVLAQPVAQSEAVGGASAEEVEPLGYRLEGEEVVFALEFAEPLSPARREALSGEGPSGAVLAGEWVAAAVWTDYPTHACLDAVRGHVELALGE